MEIRIYGVISKKWKMVNLDVSNIQQAMAGLKQIVGADIVKHIMNNPHYFFLSMKDDDESIVSLNEGMITMPFSQYDVLIITPDISGDILPIVWAIIYAVVAVVLVAAVMLLSPTPEFDEDPSEAQGKSSSLYNGALNRTEQGGSVPLNYGKSLSGGVRISSGMYAEDV